jgi:hypothetical protein
LPWRTALMRLLVTSIGSILNKWLKCLLDKETPPIFLAPDKQGSKRKIT